MVLARSVPRSRVSSRTKTSKSEFLASRQADDFPPRMLFKFVKCGGAFALVLLSLLVSRDEPTEVLVAYPRLDKEEISATSCFSKKRIFNRNLRAYMRAQSEVLRSHVHPR